MPLPLEAKSEVTTGKHGDRGRYVTTENGSQIFLTQDGQIGQTGESIDGGDAKPPVRNRPVSIPKKTMQHEGGGIGIDLDGRLPMQQQAKRDATPEASPAPQDQPGESDEAKPQYDSPFIQSFANAIIANIRKHEQDQQQPKPAAPNPQDHPHHISKLPIPMRQSLLNWMAEIDTLTKPVAWAKQGARGSDPKGVMKSAFDQIDKTELGRVMGNLQKLIAVGDQQGTDLRPFVRHNNLVPRELAPKLKPSDLFDPIQDSERYRADSPSLADQFTAAFTMKYAATQSDVVIDRLIAAQLGITVEQYAARKAKNSPGQMSLFGDGLGGDSPLRTASRQQKLDWDETKVKRDDEGKFATSAGGGASAKAEPTKNEHGAHVITPDDIGGGGDGTFDQLHAGLASEIVQSKIAIGMKGIEGREYAIMQTKGGKWQLASRAGAKDEGKDEASEKPKPQIGKVIDKSVADLLRTISDATSDPSSARMSKGSRFLDLTELPISKSAASELKKRGLAFIQSGKTTPEFGKGLDITKPGKSFTYIALNEKGRESLATFDEFQSARKATRDAMDSGESLTFDELNSNPEAIDRAIKEYKTVGDKPTFGDLVEGPDGRRGFMQGSTGMGSDRTQIRNPKNERDAQYYNRSELKKLAPSRDKSKFNFDQHVKIAADSIDKLRKSDVYRLIETVPDTDTAKMVADMIGQKRPDLKDEAMSSLFDYLQDAPTPGKYSASIADMVADRLIAAELGLTVEQYAARKKPQKGQQEFEWITVNADKGKGQPVMIDKKDGTILAGMGGKFDGQKIGEIGKGKGGAKAGDAKAKPTESPDKRIEDAIIAHGGHEATSADNVDAIRNSLYRSGERSPSHADIREAMQNMRNKAGEQRKPEATAVSPDEISSLKAKDRFTDSSGQEYEIHKSRFGTAIAHPIVNGQPQVNRDSGVAFSLDDNAKAKNPDHRIDIQSVSKWTNPDAPSPGNKPDMEAHRKNLMAMAAEHDRKKAGNAITDVTPAGYGPSESEPKPDKQLTTEQNRLKNNIQESQTLLRGDAQGDKRKSIESNLRNSQVAFDESESENLQASNRKLKRDGFQPQTLQEWKDGKTPSPGSKETSAKPAAEATDTSLKYSKIDDIDIPAVGEMNSAKKQKEQAKELMKSIRGNPRWNDGSRGRPGDLQLQMIKAQTISEKASARIASAEKEIEKRANELGKTIHRNKESKPDATAKPAAAQESQSKTEWRSETLSEMNMKQLRDIFDGQGRQTYVDNMMPKTKGELVQKIIGFQDKSKPDSKQKSIESGWSLRDRTIASQNRQIDQRNQELRDHQSKQSTPAPAAYEPPTIPGQQTSLFGGDDLNTGQKSLFNMARPSKADQRAAKRDMAPPPASLLEQIDDEEAKRLDSRKSLPGQRDMFRAQFEAAMIEQYRAPAAKKSGDDKPKKPKTVIGNKGDRGRFVTTEAGDVIFIEGKMQADGNIDTSQAVARKRREKAKHTDPDRFVPVNDEDHAIVRAVGDRKKDVAYFKEYVDEAHKEVSNRYREDADAMRETLAQFGYTGKKASGFLSSLQRRRDTSNIPGFDEMLDYVQKHHRQLLTARPGESQSSTDEEYMLFARLKEGFPPAPKKSDPEVINAAWGMSGIEHSGMPSEWDAQESDAEPSEEWDDVPFSASPLAATERYAATFANAFKHTYRNLATLPS